jgi:hypothetical protein
MSNKQFLFIDGNMSNDFYLQMFLTMVLYYCDLFFGLYPSSLCFVITTFRRMALPLSLGGPVGPSIEAG